MKKISIAVHGGALVTPKAHSNPKQALQIRESLQRAVRAGFDIMKEGGSSLDAVEQAVILLEDAPEFNAGRGAVLAADGSVELDASIMEGTERRAGAVIGVSTVKNPVVLARRVMGKTPHLLLAGRGAELFAKEEAVEQVERSYFDGLVEESEELKFGTVGAVACDAFGHLAAATSTGGLKNKRPGRVSDSALIGSGTFADDKTCAVSTTGQGEYFIRLVAAHDVAALMEYRGLTLEQAAQMVIQKIGELGGRGGLIAVDAKGHLALPFNTPAMYCDSLHGSISPLQ